MATVGIELADVATAIEAAARVLTAEYCRQVTGTEPTPEQAATIVALCVTIIRERSALAAIAAGGDPVRLARLCETVQEAERVRIVRSLTGPQMADAGAAN